MYISSPSVNNNLSHDHDKGTQAPAALPPHHASQQQQQQPAQHQPYVEGIIKLGDIITCPSEVMCVRFSIDATLLAVGLADGTVRIYNCDTSQFVYSLSDDEVSLKRLPVTSLHFCPFPQDMRTEYRHIIMATYASSGAVGSKGTVKFWHYTTGACLQTVRERRQTLSSALNIAGNGFITGGAEPDINLYDMESKKLLRTMAPSDSRDIMNGHRSRVFALKYHPTEPHVFVSGGWDDTVQFWDDRVKHSVRKISGPHICGESLDIDGTHDHILTGSWRRERPLQIWNFDGKKLKEIPQDPVNPSLLYCSQWLGRDFIVCAGCETNMLRIIDRGTLSNLGQLLDLPKGIYCLDQDRYNTKPRLAAGSDCYVYMLRLEKRS